MKFNYLSYYNKYKYKINDRDDFGDYDEASCFSSLFNCCDGNDNNSGELKIWMCSDKTLNNSLKSNFVILNEKELKFYFNWVRFISGFKFRVIKKTFTTGNKIVSGYMISSKFKNKSGYEVKTFATLIRNAYEAPFNVQVKVALNLNNVKELKSLDFTQKMILAMNSIQGTDNREVHAIYNPCRECKLTKRSELKKRFILNNKTRQRYVSNLLLIHNETAPKKLTLINDGTFDNIENGVINKELCDLLIDNYKKQKNNE